MRRLTRLAVAVLAIVLSLAFAPAAALADVSVDDVKEMILGLSEDPRDYTEADRAKVEAIEAAYDALTDEERKQLDEETAAGASQPYGRVLEAAVWSVKALEVPDNATTLPNGTYDATTTPALSSSYSKGKSTSPRERRWSVKSVAVREGKAYATITVESSTYPAMITGGKTYENAASTGNAVFEDVPIDLNSTFYFAGVSSSMPRPIAFSLTTEIDEPEAGDSSLSEGAEAVRKMIEALPFDPWSITVRDASDVEAAELAYEALSESDREALDGLQYRTQTYGRALEQANWALEALKEVDSATSLKDGTYTGKVAFESSMGKSTSARARKFYVDKVVVSGSKATAYLRYEGTSADMVLTGGRVYRHVNSDEEGQSEFEVPVKLNSPLYLVMLAKNPTSSTIGITYMVTTSVDESSTVPDAENAASQGAGASSSAGSGSSSGSGESSGEGSDGSGSGSNEKGSTVKDGSGDQDSETDGDSDGDADDDDSDDDADDDDDDGDADDDDDGSDGSGSGNSGGTSGGVRSQGGLGGPAQTSSSTSNRTSALASTGTAASAGSGSQAARAGSSQGGVAAGSGDADLQDGGPSAEAAFALMVILVVCPLVALVSGAAAFALWFARHEMLPASSSRAGW